ncbi:MAG TPA: nuclear transport factor 2 family protein [Gemmatimonadales bacterium]|nr:nuclear transport factor 2 family protein [Gemmatimonadales bacterium]
MHRVLLGMVFATSSCPTLLLGQANSAGLTRQVFVAESSFAASMAKRDLEAFAGMLSEEAVFFADTGALRGKTAVVEGWRKFFVGEVPFSWEPEVIEVLPSGTLALSSGPVRDPSGTRVGTFNSIWRREPDGRWRVIFDKGGPACTPERKLPRDS